MQSPEVELGRVALTCVRTPACVPEGFALHAAGEANAQAPMIPSSASSDQQLPSLISTYMTECAVPSSPGRFELYTASPTKKLIGCACFDHGDRFSDHLDKRVEIGVWIRPHIWRDNERSGMERHVCKHKCTSVAYRSDAITIASDLNVFTQAQMS